MTGARTRQGWSIRRLPSGRWQTVVRTVDGGRVSLGTYPTELAASHAAEEAHVDRRRGVWVDPRRSGQPLENFLAGWLAGRAGTGRHGDRYQADAARLARLHILPGLGRLPLGEITAPTVRAWHQQLETDRRADAGQVGLIPAKAYRLLRACLADAVRDELLTRNPCDIPGAGVERSPERPLLDLDQLAAAVDAAPARRKALVLVAIWGGLRFGELAALRRCDVDVLRRTVTVVHTVSEVGPKLALKAPKTAAGRRTIVLPAPTAAALADHLDMYVGPGATAAVFRGERGGLLRRRTWAREWRRIRLAAGLADGVRFHDLRHASGTMAAQAGATERELLARLGHASAATARRYQHAAQSRDEELADRLGLMAERAQRTVSARILDFEEGRRV